MHIRIVTFQLDGIDEHEYLGLATAVAPAFAAWPGLRSKTWLRNAETNTYGGVYVFDSAEASDASRRTDLYQQMSANPSFANIEVREFSVIEELTPV